MFKVVTPAGGGSDFTHEMAALGPAGGSITEVPADEAGFIAAARDADAVYGRGTRITAAIIDQLDACKVISLGSVGVDLVDVAAATAKGIAVTNCPDTFIEEVADHAMALLLAAQRRLLEQDRMVREGRWKEGRPALYQVDRLMGRTLGFIAFGHIPRAVARRAAPFGLRMIAYDPFVDETVMPPYGVLPASLDEVLSTSDFISMHAPGTPEAAGMLTEAHFRRMKKNAVFINTGRGSTVQEEGLIRALQEGWIAHAALDVLEQEPPGHNNPLLSMGNVTLSPHNASASSRFDPGRKRRVGQELALVASGRWPTACVNPSVLAGSSMRRWHPVSMERGPEQLIDVIEPPAAGSSRPFSRAVRAGGLVFVSGHSAPHDPGSGITRDPGAAGQVRQALAELDRVLRAAGSGLDRVVQVSMLIQDPADYAACNAEYVKHFPGGLPARHTARFGVPTEAKVAFACTALAG